MQLTLFDNTSNQDIIKCVTQRLQAFDVVTDMIKKRMIRDVVRELRPDLLFLESIRLTNEIYEEMK